jgi:hypothetical protein
MDKKFLISFVALFVVCMGGGFVVHGLWLAPDYLLLVPAVMRPEAEANALMPYMLSADVMMAASMAWIYRVGRKDGDWIGQGLRFGLAIALVSSVPFFFIYHTVAQFPLDLMVKQCVGGMGVALVAGLTAAFVNK